MSAQSFFCVEQQAYRTIRCFADYYTWSSCLGCNPKDFFELDKSRIFYEVQVHGNHVCIFLIGAFPSEQQSGSGEQSAISQWSKYGIAWKMVPPSTPKDGSSWKSIDHFSMLPYGWIPDDGADFFVLFIRKLKENWLILCVSAEERLSQRVSRVWLLRVESFTNSIILGVAT